MQRADATGSKVSARLDATGRFANHAVTPAMIAQAAESSYQAHLLLRPDSRICSRLTTSQLKWPLPSKKTLFGETAMASWAHDDSSAVAAIQGCAGKQEGPKDSIIL